MQKMQQARNCFFSAKSQHIKNVLLFRQIVRSQTNSATLESRSDVNTAEWDRARPFEAMPTESTFGMLRSFLPTGKNYKRDASDMLGSLKKDYGDIFLWPSMLGRPKVVFTSNPIDFELVFRNEGVWPMRPGAETMKHHREKYRADFFQGEEGVILTQGVKWGKFRSAVNPVLMQQKNVRLYFKKMSEVNQQFVKRIKEIRDAKTLEVPGNFEEEINRWTLESVSVVALDKQLGLISENRDNPQVTRLFAAMSDFFELSFELEFQPSLWKYIPTPKYKRLMQAFDSIVDISSSYVNEALERLEEEARLGVERPENEKSVLEKLLKMDKKIATVMAMDMLMAGVDTTSSTFTAIMLCLAKNPEKQAKLREEILCLLPDKNSEFTEESLKHIPYLRACIKESMRMYPLIFGNGRVPQKDVILSGYRVPKGTQVFMVTTPLLRDEQHFPRPNEFLPERWLRANKNAENSLKAANPFIFLPFGFGARMCIGKRIVDMELELGVARLIRNFNVEFNHSTENAFKSLMINVPNIPLKFKFTDL